MTRAAAFLLLAAVVSAADYTAVELECPETVSYRVHRDLDGDGLEEVILVAAKEAWVWRGRTTTFPRSPDARIVFPKGTAFFDVGPDGAKKQRIVARTAADYWALVAGGQPERLSFPSGGGLPMRPANVLWRGFFHDLDGDGKGDFLDLSLGGYTIHYGGGGTVTVPPILLESADTAGDAASDRLLARYALGDWTSGRFDGDDRLDFAVIHRGSLVVYTGDERGRVDPARQRVLPLIDADDADLTFLDLNGDGKTDVLAVRRKAGRATILVADEKRGLEAPHRIRLMLPGEIHLPVADDLDGDGRPDLAFPYNARPSVEAAIRWVVRGEAILKVPIFLNRGGRSCIATRADEQISFPIRIRARTDSAGRIQLSGLVVVEYGGDLDGDGRKDLLITAKPDLLGVHRGGGGKVFAKEASGHIAIPDCSAFDSTRSAAANLNGDKRSDIILHYRGQGRRPDRVILLLSGKK